MFIIGTQIWKMFTLKKSCLRKTKRKKDTYGKNRQIKRTEKTKKEPIKPDKNLSEGFQHRKS
jgi:hypothetical protein